MTTTRAKITHLWRALGFLLTACWAGLAHAVPAQINSPLSHTALAASANPSIQFQGTYPYAAGTAISVQALNPSGGWSSFGSANVQSNGNWSVTVQVSSVFYFQPCGVGVFRALPNDGSPQLTVWDQACLNASSPKAPLCLKDLVVLSQPGRYPTALSGNLSVEGSKQAEKFICYQTVDGGLDISDSTPTKLATRLTRDQAQAEAKVSLPNLSSVSKDLKAVLSRFAVLSTVGGGSGYGLAALDLPLVAQVGGSINLRAVDLGQVHVGYQYTFGLGALTSVGANVTIDNQAAFNHYFALAALTTIPGNLTVNWTKDSDLIESSMLPNLQTVHGSVSINAKSNIQTVLPKLAVVDGNVTIQAPGYSSTPYAMIANLSHVGGNLSVVGGFDWNCNQPTFPVLGSVTGQLILDGGIPRGTIGAVGLSLGGLQIVNTLVSKLPLPAGLQVANNAVVSIQHNSKLCQCQVNSFISSLQSAGWVGSPPPQNNGAAASCSPCPAPVCQ